MDEGLGNVTEVVPLYAVTRQLRRVVDVRRLNGPLLHFSIPALEATGRPVIAEPEDIDSAKLLLSGGEVLISRLNPRKCRVVTVPEHLDLVGVASTEFVALEPVGIDRRFLAYLLASEAVTQRLASAVRSVTRSHQRVEPEQITRLRVALPVSAQQRRIADFLDDQVACIDNIIAARRAQSALVGHLDQVELQTAVSSLDDSMSSVRLGRVVSISSGHFIESAGYSADGRYPVIGGNGVSGRFNSYNVAGNVIAVGRVGALCGNVHVVAGQAWITDNALIVRPMGCHVGYLSMVLEARNLNSLASRTAQPLLTGEVVKSLVAPFPDWNTQSQVYETWEKGLTERARRRSEVVRSIQLFEELRRSLITAAVTGEFDVSSADGSRVPA